MSFAELLPDLRPWVQSLGDAFPASLIKSQGWMFPIILSLHLLALSALGGCVLLLNLRLMGVGLTGVTASSMERTLRPWLWGAVAALVFTGVLMTSVVAMKLYMRPAFLVKVLALIGALILSAGVIASVARRDGEVTMQAKILAAIGLAFWAFALFIFGTTQGPAPGTFHILCAGWLIAIFFSTGVTRIALAALTAAIVLGVGIATYGFLNPLENYDLVMEINRWTVRIGVLIVAGFLGWIFFGPAKGERLSPPLARLLGLVTILAWVTVAASGRWIGLGGG